MSDSAPLTNAPELSVSDLADKLKRTIESNFDRVRVRGELGRVTIAKSGHMYADLKDDKAVLNTIMWKGNVGRLPFRPEEGLEVVAEGKLSTYPGRSNYQLVADTMQPAGIGALMALLEERKKKLASEGLFDTQHKQKLPKMPSTIGVVTSPTGAVIRDILHRIKERFPVRVIVWPALVQGDLAAGQIVAGIDGFNQIEGDARPDLLIIARGGGSIEDLWPFNEEAVVRAVFRSGIPLISAVGHETDTTLIDFVADARAPTPTGAAEMAVPVRIELMESVSSVFDRLKQGLHTNLRHQSSLLQTASARLPRPDVMIGTQQQRFDFAEASLRRALLSMIDRKKIVCSQVAGSFRVNLLKRDLIDRTTRLGDIDRRLRHNVVHSIERHGTEISTFSARLNQTRPSIQINALSDRLREALSRLKPAILRLTNDRKINLEREAKLLETLSYQATIERGFAVVRTPSGQLIKRTKDLVDGKTYTLTLSDGDQLISPVGDTFTTKSMPSSNRKPQGNPKGQGSLF